LTVIEEPEDEDEPYTGSELRVLFDDGLSLIIGEETAQTAELRALLSRFRLPLLPADITEVGEVELIWTYNYYVETGRIEPFTATEEEFQEIWERHAWGTVMPLESLDYIFADIFSRDASSIVPVYERFANEDGLTGVTPRGLHGGYQLILMGQTIGEDIIELYYYKVYSVDGELLRKGYEWHDNPDDGVYWLDETVVGYWDYDADEALSYAVLYEDLFDTLDVVKYRFILEDGRFKILSIENVA
jgi:hypothetical protein